MARIFIPAHCFAHFPDRELGGIYLNWFPNIEDPNLAILERHGIKRKPVVTPLRTSLSRRRSNLPFLLLSVCL